MQKVGAFNKKGSLSFRHRDAKLVQCQIHAAL